jgi:acetyl esterase/lipase
MSIADAEATVTVHRDVPFREQQGRQLHLDTYLPEIGTDRPAVVFVHGGAWIEGSKGQFSRYSVRLASMGYVGVSPNYRLADEASIPEMAADVRAAVRWTRANADELGVDPDRIALAGHSAGGHLAALAALAPDEDGPVNVQALAGFSGVYDFRTLPAVGPHVDVLGGTADDVPDRYREASPITHVTGGTPPTFLAHAIDDEVVPIEQTDAFYQILLGETQYVERFRADGGGHGFLYDDGQWYDRTFGRFREFLDAQLEAKSA